MRRRGQDGIALVIVLWGAMLLSLLATSLAQSAGLAVRQMSHEIDAAQARAQLDEAVAATILALTDPDSERRWRADGAPHRLALLNAAAEIRADSEFGKIDLNHAPPALLQSFLRQAAGNGPAGDKLAAALAHRTDPTLGRPLLTVTEIAGLPGMTPAIFRAITEAATVHNISGKLDWRSAGKAALSAVPGMSAGQVATLLAMRQQSLYTPDPSIIDALTKAGVMMDATTDQTTGGGMMVTLHIIVSTPHGAQASADALLQLLPTAPRLYRVIEWRAPA